MAGPAPIQEISIQDSAELSKCIAQADRPLVFRGLVSDWPLVVAAKTSMSAARYYLLGFYDDAQVTAFVGDKEGAGRIFYSPGLEAFNFQPIKTSMDWVFERLAALECEAEPETIYMGSAAIDACLPGLGEENRLPVIPESASVRIWIGNQTTVAAHYDVTQNVACVCAGRRRFTLFPPEQVENLYVGPLDFTPAGQSVSLVDLEAPDLDCFPRFAHALEHAQSAELLPGDGLFIPSMWWHHVQGLERFNVLVNHWWRDSASYMGPPGDVLLHALLNLRDLPDAQRAAWRAHFEYYVFGPRNRAIEHLPPDRRGALGDLDGDMARRLRALLRNHLNR